MTADWLQFNQQEVENYSIVPFIGSTDEPQGINAYCIMFGEKDHE